jgi:4'-phosphopantetheinyl transferase
MSAASAYSFEIIEKIENGAGRGWRPLAPTEVVVALARPEESERHERSISMALLSEEEKQRLARFRFERDRHLFLAAHSLLRVTLSRYADVEPYVWQFRSGRYGRPEIAEPTSRLRFSVSHTRGLAACAVMLDRDIGLDVEDISKGAPAEVAHRFFSPCEARDVLCAPLESRARRFFTYWTLKEAYCKARGLGLSVPLDQFSLHEDDGAWRIAFEPPIEDEPGRWCFWSWHAGEHHQAALAIANDAESVA